jgi:hypothetical protein
MCLLARFETVGIACRSPARTLEMNYHLAAASIAIAADRAFALASPLTRIADMDVGRLSG